MRRKYAKAPFVRFWISFKVTLACLAWLFVLTVWGTVFQVQFGLFHAQEKIFNSWIIPVMGWLPFPGARLIIWVLFINLVFVTLFRFQYKWSKLGLLIIHLGMFVLIFSAWVTFHFAVESNLTLGEGEGSNVTADYNYWELSLWHQSVMDDTLFREVTAFDFRSLAPAVNRDVPELSTRVEILEAHSNCRALLGPLASQSAEPARNVSGIMRLQAQLPSLTPQENLPGIVLKVYNLSDTAAKPQRVILFGGEEEPTPVALGSRVVFLSLRHRRYPMPVTLSLIDFQKEEHPGTQIASSFKSVVELITRHVKREVTIFMNNPLRVEDFTFYQASFSQSSDGETSTLAVVRHPGRLLPYISSLIIGAGLCLHFLIMLFKYSRKKLGAGR